MTDTDQGPSEHSHLGETNAKETYDHRALKLWLRLLTCTSLIERSIRRDLRQTFDCTLARFDVLAQLARVPQGLKMNELSRRLMVTGGNITGLADQLQTEGLIAREQVEGDRRATRLTLTKTGEARFADMARVHEDWVKDLFSPLSPTQQDQLMQLLNALKTGLAALGEGPDDPVEPGPGGPHPVEPDRVG
jgi:DNA-binding MarR family transcriptional regulator